MPGDPFAGLFKRRFEIDIPGGAAEMHARRLAHRGLIHIDERTYVRCVNPLDPDQQRWRDGSCSGRIYLSRDRDESNGEYQCPDCGREIYPSKKEQRASLRIIPDEEAMRAFVLERIAEVSRDVEERPFGLYRIPLVAGEARICLVDFCRDPAVFSETYSYRDTLVFVVGNDRDYRRRLPPRIPVYRLAELALDDAVSSFHRTVRRLIGRQVAAPVPFGPAVAALPGQRMTLSIVQAPRTPSPPSLPGRIQVPPGTRWNTIKIYLVDGETLAIHVPGQKLKRYHHQQLGMANKRTGKPSKKWELLEKLCNGYGQISWTGTAREFGAFKEQVSGLRLTLQELFGIKSDPFQVCSRSEGLRAAYQAFPDLPEADIAHRLP